jgi:hypothetical protein
VGRAKHILPPLVLAALIASLWPARAVAAKVVIVRPGGATPALNETLSRLQGEMLSLGLEVAIAERPAVPRASPADARAWVERMATERETEALIDVVDDSPRLAVDIWVVERATHRTEVSRVTLEPDAENAAARLAIRAVEVLRSSLVEIDLAMRRQRPAAAAAGPPATIEQARPREPAAPIAPVDVQAGAALLASLDGVGPAVMPIVRGGWAARPWLTLQGAAAGFGSRPTVTSATGSARVAQRYAVVGACYCARSPRLLQPAIALSAGALHTEVDGQADAPASGHLVARWSFLLEVSLGVRLRLPSRYHLTVAAHVQAAAPYVAIHFVDTLVATSGRPNLGVSLTLGAWL